VIFIEMGLMVALVGMLGCLIGLLALRKHRFAVRSMLDEHKGECLGQMERLRLEVQLPRPEKIGRREMQLIARIAVHPRGQAPG
jgi:hypothetical protein